MKRALGGRLQRLEDADRARGRDDDDYKLWLRVFLARRIRGLAHILNVTEPPEIQFVMLLSGRVRSRLNRVGIGVKSSNWKESHWEKLAAGKAAGLAAGPSTMESYAKDLERLLAQLKALTPP